jgi:hypothetical protein
VEFIVGIYNNHIDNNVDYYNYYNNNVAGIDDDSAGTNYGATGTKFSSYYRSNFGGNNYNPLVVKCSANLVIYNFCCGYCNNS